MTEKHKQIGERVLCGDCIYRECIDNGRCLKENSQWFRSIVKEDNWCGKGVRDLHINEADKLADSLLECRRGNCDGCIRQGCGDGDCTEILWADAVTMIRRLREEVSCVDLKKAPTCDLAAELRSRAGVETTMAEPHEDVTVKVNGPAIVLVVTD